MKTKLSIILPAYNEELMISKVCEEIKKEIKKLDVNYELIFINDGSKDDTWKEIKKEQEKDNKIVGINFSKNFGKESAVFAGLVHSTGDVVAVMDCDLQHPPAALIKMYQMWERGFQVIEGIKTDRGKESSIHKGCSEMFYSIMSKIMKIDMQNTSDFKMLDRKAVNAILLMPERNMFFRATSSWIGFKTGYVSFEVQERMLGKSKWSTWSLVKYALTNMAAFTTVPLQFVSFTGALSFLCSLVLMIYSLIQYFNGFAVEGYTTTLIVLLMIGSAIMLSLGIIGYYIAKIYEEVKQRPRYIISELVRIHDEDDMEDKKEE